MPATTIHPTASVSAQAVLGEGCRIGPFAVVEDHARLGAHTQIAAHGIVRAGCTIGRHCSIDSFAVIGGDPQTLSLDPDRVGGVDIGDHTRIREGVTVHRSSQPRGVTRIGNSCFLMANAHVGHDCTLHDRVIMANAVLLSGHVEVASDCFLGGGAAVHQFIRVGEGVMLGGLTAVSQDIPPFCLVAERNHTRGLNLVGLKRRAVPRDAIRELKDLYRTILKDPGSVPEKARQAADRGSFTSAEASRFLSFFEAEKRTYMRHASGSDSA